MKQTSERTNKSIYFMCFMTYVEGRRAYVHIPYEIHEQNSVRVHQYYIRNFRILYKCHFGIYSGIRNRCTLGFRRISGILFVNFCFKWSNMHRPSSSCMSLCHEFSDFAQHKRIQPFRHNMHLKYGHIGNGKNEHFCKKKLWQEKRKLFSIWL